MKFSEIIARVCPRVFTHSGRFAAGREVQSADSVEKVGCGFHERKVRAWDWNLYFNRRIPGSHFA